MLLKFRPEVFIVYFLLVVLQFGLIIGLLIEVGATDFVKFFSRWCYIFVAIYFTLWLLGYGSYQYNQFFRKYSYATVFFYNGLIWLWTILTIGLVIAGAPLIFEDRKFIERSDVGLLLILISIAHFSPVFILTIYIYAYRNSLAWFWYNSYLISFKLFGYAITNIIVAFYMIFLPLIPALIYSSLFNPFEVYEIDPEDAPFWAFFIIASLVMIVIQFTLVYFLRCTYEKIKIIFYIFLFLLLLFFAFDQSAYKNNTEVVYCTISSSSSFSSSSSSSLS